MTRPRHRKHANPFTIRGPIEVPDWQQLFGRQAPMALDVGFGRGAFLLALAQRNPAWNVLGLEIRQHHVDEVMEASRSAGLKNVYAVLGNVNQHLEALIPSASLAFVSLNFPDPWFKKRHQKRRVVDANWLRILGRKLRLGATFHAMTDQASLAHEIRDYAEKCGDFVNLAGLQHFASSSTTGIVSEREIKHLGRHERIYRMHFRYVGMPANDRWGSQDLFATGLSAHRNGGIISKTFPRHSNPCTTQSNLESS